MIVLFNTHIQTYQQILLASMFKVESDHFSPPPLPTPWSTLTGLISVVSNSSPCFLSCPHSLFSTEWSFYNMGQIMALLSSELSKASSHTQNTGYRALHDLALLFPLLPSLLLLLPAPWSLCSNLFVHLAVSPSLAGIPITCRSRLECHLISEAFPSILPSHWILPLPPPPPFPCFIFHLLALTTIQHTLHLTCLSLSETISSSTLFSSQEVVLSS